MRLTLIIPAVLACAVLSVGGCASAPPGAGTEGAGGATLRAFRSEDEFLAFNQRLVREMERRMQNEPPPPAVPMPPSAPPPPPSAPAPPGAPPAAPVTPTAAPGAASESVTNVQHAGVDEGGIVKVHGNHLVILRRGRLFTVRVGDGALEPVSSADAFGPGIDPQGAWYDEMLLFGDQVVVIGYSYQRGGTELGIFRITPDGQLAHRATYHLRSGDYYSSRNYASRLIGSRLIFYAPLPVNVQAEDPFASFPAFRRWGVADSTWRRTATATRVYRPAGRVSLDDELMLHTVTMCELGGEELDCQATALYGPRGRVFYVSPRSVYVWATQWPGYDAGEDAPARSVLYRMPLDGGAPTALRVAGGPIDQFSFLESGDAHLNVLVASDGGSEGMWGAEWARGDLALLRVPLAAFGDGSRAAPAERYRRLPLEAGGGTVQNRYVGDWLLYGKGSGWGRPQGGGARAYGVRWADAGPAAELALPHGVDRIEQMGSGAVVVGSDGRDLHFSGVRLGASAALAHRYTRAGASQGETRSHGFFYRPDAEDTGLLGLPIRSAGRPGGDQLAHGSASILFLRNQAFQLRELGDLAASAAAPPDDACRASCVDWYGNARPLFLRGRIFALMGYELVEGAENDGRIREVRRVGFSPRLPPVAFGGQWAYEESLSGASHNYWCSSRGTYDFDVDGARLGVRYRQTGECSVEGRRQDAAGEGSGAGTVSSREIDFTVDTCRYTGRVTGEGTLAGRLQCRIRMPDGREVEANGYWTARRS